MPADPVQRRLAAILAADVVGYSRLMGTDEEGTLAALTANRAELIAPCIADHRGRVVKTTGDGLLAEFASAVDAVSCAVAIQDGMRRRNADTASERRLELRIGVNIGDVIIQEDDVYGDGVNIAARLEGLAEPGGIVVSGMVRDTVRAKLDLAFEDLGAQPVKNIVEPVRVWRIAPDAARTGANVKGDAKADVTAPDTAGMPSIAVLPFQNMSGDPEQEYFADGMVEEIITALSRFRWLLVAARNSSFVFKGRAVDVRAAAAELGVRYVLEGSVRRAGDRVRITGQLIDAATGAHLWADRYDGTMADIFDLQDEVTAAVVGAIEPNLRRAEIERSLRKHPQNLTAYDLFLRALGPVNMLRPDANAEALDLLQRAVALDPGHAPALAYSAFCHEQRLLHGWSTAPREDADKAVRLARAALAINTGDAAAIAMAAFVLAIVGHDWDSARIAARRALDLNPNSAGVCWKASWTMLFDGEPDEALAIAERSLRLSPADPQASFLLNAIGMCHLIQGRPAEALEAALRSVAAHPDIDVAYYILLPAAALLERAEHVARAKSKLLSLAPDVTVASFEHRMPFRRKEHSAILLDGLRRAGLPE